MRRRPVLVSVHDVMPSTLDRVASLLAFIEAKDGIQPDAVDLLVVPGAEWDEETLARLREWVAKGYRLAGHGWTHRAERIRGFYHRLHSVVISRDVAEHLALSRDELRDLVQCCYCWFADNELPSPATYVPPSWAMGALRRRDLDELPFRYYETLSGIYDSAAGVFRRVPLIGFEADTALRASLLHVTNALNGAMAQLSGRPLRIGLHPHDLHLRMVGAVERLFQQPIEARSCDDCLDG